MLVWQQSVQSGRIIEVAPVFLAGVLASYLFLDGLFVYLTVAQLGLYAIFAVGASTVAATAITQLSLRSRELGFLMVWVAICCIYLLPALAAEYQYPRYIFTDLIATLIPAALLLVGLRYPQFFISKQTVMAIAATALVASMLAVVASESSSRHEPPPVILIAAAWAAFHVARSKRAVRWSVIGLVGVLLLAVTSGERTAVLLWLGLGLAGQFYIRMRLRNLLLTLAATVLAAALALILFSESLLLFAASTRFESLAQGEVDASILNRVLEVADTWSQWSLRQWYGFGHGATYVPDLSYLPRNFTEHGRVHNIHFGPMLMIYRYGLPGIVLNIWLLADLLHTAIRRKRIGYEHDDRFVSLFFLIALTGYLASFLAFNVIPDPAFSYVLAGYLYFRLVRRTPTIRARTSTE